VKQKAIGYVRVSTQEQARGGVSLAQQERSLRAYAKAKGWKLLEVCRDEGASGKSLDREGIRGALQALAKDEASILLVAKLDRLSRSVRDIFTLAEDVFGQDGKHLASLGESIDTTTAMGRAMLGMAAVFAQMERELIGERTRNGLAEVKAQGKHLGNVPIKKKRRDGRLVTDKAEVNRIRRAKRMKKKGASWREVAEAFGWTVSQARVRLDERQRDRGRRKKRAA
jgi:site-specific DNA recombinase